MAEDNGGFQDKLRSSFSNIKKDMFSLRKDIDSIKNQFEQEKNTNLSIKRDIGDLKSSLSEIKGILTNSTEDSTGNKGVHQQSSTIINNHQQSTVNNHQQPGKAIKTMETIETLEIELSNLFKNLTDREFSVFVAIHSLERQNGETTYSQIANQLNLTETTVRGTVNRLIAKNLPVTKERAFNGKTTLFLKKDFHDLNLLGKLINLRQNHSNQTTLLD